MKQYEIRSIFANYGTLSNWRQSWIPGQWAAKKPRTLPCWGDADLSKTREIPLPKINLTFIAFTHAAPQYTNIYKSWTFSPMLEEPVKRLSRSSLRNIVAEQDLIQKMKSYNPAHCEGWRLCLCFSPHEATNQEYIQRPGSAWAKSLRRIQIHWEMYCISWFHYVSLELSPKQFTIDVASPRRRSRRRTQTTATPNVGLTFGGWMSPWQHRKHISQIWWENMNVW